MKQLKIIDLSLFILATLSTFGLAAWYLTPYIAEIYFDFFPTSQQIYYIDNAPYSVQFFYRLHQISLPTLSLSIFFFAIILLIKFSQWLQRKLDEKDQKILEARKFKN